MNTTNLFVELLVIGLGPLLAIAALLWVGMDPELVAATSAGMGSLALLLPLLGLMYVLGIVTDRLADRLFSGPAFRLRMRFFESNAEYHRARRTIVLRSEMMYQLRQYGRSRMRITRGWALNSALLVVPLNLWAVRFASTNVVLVVNGTLLFLLLGCIYSWRALALSEYQKIKGGAEFIRGEAESATG